MTLSRSNLRKLEATSENQENNRYQLDIEPAASHYLKKSLNIRTNLLDKRCIINWFKGHYLVHHQAAVILHLTNLLNPLISLKKLTWNLKNHNLAFLLLHILDKIQLGKMHLCK